MDLYRIIFELVQERNRIQRIIESLEDANRADHPLVPRKRRGRKAMDRAAREEVSERMKRYWAKRRAEEADRAREPADPVSPGPDAKV